MLNKVNVDTQLEMVVAALEHNYSKAEFVRRYGKDAAAKARMLFGMGDGNHSLAAAKKYWESLKEKKVAMDHPARYALVEINNVHDEGIVFEPIHRLLKNVPDVEALKQHIVSFLNNEDANENPTRQSAYFSRRVREWKHCPMPMLTMLC